MRRAVSLAPSALNSAIDAAVAPAVRWLSTRTANGARCRVTNCGCELLAEPCPAMIDVSGLSAPVAGAVDGATEGADMLPAPDSFGSDGIGWKRIRP